MTMALRSNRLSFIFILVIAAGSGPASGFRERYNSNAIVYPPSSNGKSSENASPGHYHYQTTTNPRHDLTLLIVTPIAVVIFLVVVIFFCWAVRDADPADAQFDYERMEEGEPRPSGSGTSRPVPGGADQDSILDLPYTGARTSPSRDED